MPFYSQNCLMFLCAYYKFHNRDIELSQLWEGSLEVDNNKSDGLT